MSTTLPFASPKHYDKVKCALDCQILNLYPLWHCPTVGNWQLLYICMYIDYIALGLATTTQCIGICTSLLDWSVIPALHDLALIWTVIDWLGHLIYMYIDWYRVYIWVNRWGWLLWVWRSSNHTLFAVYFFSRWGAPQSRQLILLLWTRCPVIRRMPRWCRARFHVSPAAFWLIAVSPQRRKSLLPALIRAETYFWA